MQFQWAKHAAATTAMLCLALASPAAQAADGSKVLGPLAANQTVSFALTLPLQNQAGLTATLSHIYSKGDPAFHHFLTSDEFNAQFAPAPAQYQALTAYATSHGLTIRGTHAGRTVLDVAGPAATVGSLFGVAFERAQTADGRAFSQPSGVPQTPAALSAMGAQVVGMSARPAVHDDLISNGLTTNNITSYGSGPNGTFAPIDIRTAYQVNSLSQTGAGQHIALLELSTADYSDAGVFSSSYGLPAPNVNPINVDGGTTDFSGGTEVILDIDMVEIMAPNASNIDVYTGPNTGAGVLDTYTAIADADADSIVSSSWGLYEAGDISSNPGLIQSEETVFEKMAAQGQSIFAAAGDSGALDNGSTLSVDDPASDPYVTGVGGTSLAINSDLSWAGETTWNDLPTYGISGAGGGGISSVWTLPWYQGGFQFLGAPGQYSTVMRNVPDISLNADIYPGYGIYLDINDAPEAGDPAGWYQIGGTSAAAPLWASFTSLVDEQLAASSDAPLGFANPALYQTGETSADAFHDIADGSNNFYYLAVPGYDDATGWGSLIAPTMFNALITAATVHTKAQPTVILTSSTPSIGVNLPVTLTVTFAGHTGPTTTGTVAIKDGITTLATVPLVEGVGTYLATFSTTGTHNLTATYNGDVNYDTAVGLATQIVYNVAVVTVTSSANPATVGQTLTFTAIVAAQIGDTVPTGSVTATDGPTVLGTVPLNGDGRAIFTDIPSTGTTHLITASYSGGSTFGAATGNMAEYINAATEIPLADAYTQLGTPTTNYGTATTLLAKNNSGGDTRDIYLRFPVPIGSVGNSTLELFGSTLNTTADTDAVDEVFNNAWGENTIDWSNQPTPGAALQTQTIGKTTQYYSWNLGTSLESFNNQVSLAVGMTDTPSNAQNDTFHSKENATDPPKLALTYLDAPVFVQPPTCAPNPVTGAHAVINALAADSGGESKLVYNWYPANGNEKVTFSANGTNSAKNNLVTFGAVGTYGLVCTAVNGNGQSVSATVNVTVTAASADTNYVVLYPTADAFVKSSAPGSNFGHATDLLVQDDTGGNLRYSYLMFDLSTVPGTITGGQLALDGNNLGTVYSGSDSVYATATNWTETGLTFNKQPALGPYLGSAYITNTQRFYQWDVSPYLLGGLSSSEASFRVSMDNIPPNGEPNEYFSRENSSAEEPELIVSYIP